MWREQEAFFIMKRWRHGVLSRRKQVRKEREGRFANRCGGSSELFFILKRREHGAEQKETGEKGAEGAVFGLMGWCGKFGAARGHFCEGKSISCKM
ncbi:hypothetical protein MO973_44210 [Paenibacillus sp. TRM 82003]|nr:hypothetical protein [Paenibacillus sp. TRM 82003]